MKNILSKAIRLTALGATVVAIGTGNPARGASVSFLSSATQLDGDPILDIGTTVGQTVSIAIAIDTTGLSANLVSLRFTADEDITEFVLDQNQFVPSGFLDIVPTSIVFFPVVNGILTHEATLLAPGAGIPTNTFSVEDTLVYTVQPGLRNDGLSDLTFRVLSAFDANGTDVTALFQPSSQQVELQPVSEPSTLGEIAGIGLIGVGVFCKRKQTGKRGPK